MKWYAWAAALLFPLAAIAEPCAGVPAPAPGENAGFTCEGLSFSNFSLSDGAGNAVTQLALAAPDSRDVRLDSPAPFLGKDAGGQAGSGPVARTNSPIPEPATVGLMGSGLFLLELIRRKKG